MNLKVNKFIYIILFLSGFCSLVYQVAWERLIRSHFGGDYISAYIVTSTFLLGLGLGAFLFRKTSSNPLLIYSRVEIFISIFAISSYFLITNFSYYIVPLFIPYIDLESFRFILIMSCFLIILLPCILMGATLPLVFKSFLILKKYETKKIAFFYASNTIGASVGILSIPFVFFNNINIKETLIIVGFLNLILGFILYFFSKSKNLSFDNNIDNSYTDIEISHIRESKRYKYLIYLFAFISGGIALSMELIYFRTAAINFPSSAYNFPFVLMIFLFFLSVGSIFFSYISKDSKNNIFFILSILFLFSSFSIISFLIINTNFNPIKVRFILVKYFLMIAPFAFFQGGIFPLLLKLLSPYSKNISKATGNVYLINSLGSFIFTFFIQFYFFNYFGSKFILITLFLLAIIISLIISLSKKIYILSIISFLSIITIYILPKKYWEFHLNNSSFLLENKVNVLAIEGETGFASIEFNLNENNTKQGIIKVNGMPMATIPNHPRLKELSIFPLNTIKKSDVLVLGLGGSNVIKEIAKEEDIKTIDVIDWSHELPKLLSSKKVKSFYGNILDNEKIKLYQTDARKYLIINKKPYDLIFDNLANTFWVGSTNIKSISYFKEISKSMKKDGVYILSNNTIGLSDKNAVLSGIIKSFKYVILFSDDIVLASNSECLNNLTNFYSGCLFNIDNIKKYIFSNKNKLPEEYRNDNWNFNDNIINIKLDKSLLDIDPIYDNFPKYEYHLF